MINDWPFYPPSHYITETIIKGESLNLIGSITPKSENIAIEIYWSDIDRDPSPTVEHIDTVYTDGGGNFLYPFTPSDSGQFLIIAVLDEVSSNSELYVYEAEPINTGFLPSVNGFAFNNYPYVIEEYQMIGNPSLGSIYNIYVTLAGLAIPKIYNTEQLGVLRTFLPLSPQPLLVPGHCVLAYKLVEYGVNVDIYIHMIQM